MKCNNFLNLLLFNWITENGNESFGLTSCSHLRNISKNEQEVRSKDPHSLSGNQLLKYNWCSALFCSILVQVTWFTWMQIRMFQWVNVCWWQGNWNRIKFSWLVENSYKKPLWRRKRCLWLNMKRHHLRAKTRITCKCLHILLTMWQTKRATPRFRLPQNSSKSK